MVDEVTDALARSGIHDEIVAAAPFFPRGHFAAGLIGGDLGDRVDGLAGALADRDANGGAPERMLVGVSNTAVYVLGMRRNGGGRQRAELALRLPRAQLDVRVHRRVKVRVLELFDRGTGARVELEGGIRVGGVLHALKR